jgi:lysozyme
MTDGNFNVGCTGLGWYTNAKGQKVRTTLWRHAQAANWKGVLRAADGLCELRRQAPQGLVNRREEFKAWCLSDPALKGAK